MIRIQNDEDLFGELLAALTTDNPAIAAVPEGIPTPASRPVTCSQVA